MHHLRPENASVLLATPKWRQLLTIALAAAYPRHIVHRCGDDYKSAVCQKDLKRTSLHLPQRGAKVEISVRSVCHRNHAIKGIEWVVYTGTGRHPRINGITPLPRNIAAWFVRYDDYTAVWDRADVSHAIVTKTFATIINLEHPLDLQSLVAALPICVPTDGPANAEDGERSSSPATLGRGQAVADEPLSKVHRREGP
jgi:hypothetical protein